MAGEFTTTQFLGKVKEVVVCECARFAVIFFEDFWNLLHAIGHEDIVSHLGAFEELTFASHESIQQDLLFVRAGGRCFQSFDDVDGAHERTLISRFRNLKTTKVVNVMTIAGQRRPAHGETLRIAPLSDHVVDQYASIKMTVM